MDDISSSIVNYITDEMTKKETKQKIDNILYSLLGRHIIKLYVMILIVMILMILNIVVLGININCLRKK